MPKYSDFFTDFSSHPVHKDLVMKTDILAIKQSLKNILTTNKYERFYNPSFGADITALLFEQISPLTAEVLRDVILTAIENYEPRVEVINLYVTPYVDVNSYEVTLMFAVTSINETSTLNLTLERNR